MPRTLALLLTAVASSVALLAAPAAHGSSPDLVVSHVFAGGGNSGAPLTHDFVELFNRGSTTVDVGGWTIQYATAAGTTWQVTTLSGSIAPGRYYLVQLASGGTSGLPLPAADATGTSNLANTGGKVALVRNGTALTCGASPGSCSSNPDLADLVGYGSATDYEGSGAASALSNTTALVRGAGGCSDTDDSAADFSTAAPAPRNSATTSAPCGSEPPPGENEVSASASVDVEVEAALSIALERASVSFGRTRVGQTPQPVSQQVTVTSNDQAGYALTVHRTAFQPADLPLGIAGSAPAGGTIGPALAGGSRAPIPIAPAADLLVGTTAAPSASGGDVWPLNLGFVSPIPSVPAGVYSAVVTFTVIGR